MSPGTLEDRKQSHLALVITLSFYWFGIRTCLATVMTASQLSSAAWCHCKQAAPLKFCFCHKSFFLLVWYPRLPSNNVATTLQLTDFFCPFWLSRNDPGQKYWLQKYFPENIEAIWASSFKIRAKIEIQEHFSVHLTSQTSLCMSRDMVLQSVLFSLAFYRRNLFCFFFWNLVWNSIHTVAHPSVLVSWFPRR